MDDYAVWRSRRLRSPSSSPSLRRESGGPSGAPLSPAPPTMGFAPSAIPLPPPSPPLQSTPTAPRTSVDHASCKELGARLSEVLHDIDATELGHARTWLNVQPCVMHTIKLLATAAKSREAELHQLSKVLHEAQECLAILVRDREVKEERYRLDVSAHRAETEQLWKRLLLFESQQQQQHFHPPQLPSSSAVALESRIASIERELQRRRDEPQQSFPPSHSTSSSTSSTQRGGEKDDQHHLVAPSPDTRQMVAEVQLLRRQWRHFLKSVPAATRSDGDVDGEMYEDEGNGRAQRGCGSTRLRTPPHTSTCCTHRNSTGALLSGGGVRSGEDSREEEHNPHHLPLPAAYVDRVLCDPLSSSCRRVRWYWAGEIRGRVRTAAALSSYSQATQRSQRRAARAEAPPLAWTEWHAFHGRTDCWYSLGSWATHKQQLHHLERAETAPVSNSSRSSQRSPSFAWMARATEHVAWTRPSCISVQRGGVYEVRVCLVCQRHAGGITMGGADTAEAALTVCVNGETVSGAHPVTSHFVLHAQSPTRRRPSPQRGSKVSGGVGQACGSRAMPTSLPQHTRMEEAYRLLQRRPCCEPSELQTQTITTCLYLPAGVELQVCCREPHTTHALCEALCELTYVV